MRVSLKEGTGVGLKGVWLGVFSGLSLFSDADPTSFCDPASFSDRAVVVSACCAKYS